MIVKLIDNKITNTWLENGQYNIVPAQRTTRQNKALHLYFTQLAEKLNEAGFDIKKTLSHKPEIPWTPAAIKEYLWRPVQKAYSKKSSTTQLYNDDLNNIYDIVNRFVSDKCGISVEFPNIKKKLYGDKLN